MKNKNFVLLITILFCLINLSKPLMADDTTANTDNNTADYDKDYAGKGQWGVSGNCTGTRYTIVIDGIKYEYDLPAGTKIDGTDIKGYNSTGKKDLGIQDPAYQLGADGILDLQRSEFVALVRENGNEELANKLESGASFTAFSEQYIIYAEERGGERKKILATEAMKKLEEHLANGGDKSMGIGFIRQIVKSSFISFTELDQSNPLYMYLMLLNKNPSYAEGYGIYVFGEGEGLEDLLEKLPEIEPEIEPETPIPPEPKPPESPKPIDTPLITITPGIAGGGNNGTANR